MDAGNISAMISALAGLAGVCVGAYLTHLREMRSAHRKDERDSSYLAIIVTSHLEKFVFGCWGCAHDDGTEYGQPAGEDGRYRTTVKPPHFNPLEIEVDWKVLPKDLLHDILQLPDKQHRIQSHLAGISEHADPHDDQGEYFWTRQRDYAELGLHASALTKRLRTHAGLPLQEDRPGEWNLESSLQEVIFDVDKARAAYERAAGIRHEDVQPG